MSETNPSHERGEATPTEQEAQQQLLREVSPNRQIAKSPNRSRSREMLGGPVLGVAVFLIAAILLGWGLITLLNVQLGSVASDGSSPGLIDRFDPEAEYLLKRDLLLGLSMDRQTVMLYPDYDAMPASAPNRRFVPTVADYLADPGNERYEDTLGVVPAGTRVRFERLVEDPTNRQARFIVQTRVLDGEHADIRARGLFLESVTTSDDGRPVVAPRDDLFAPAAHTDRIDEPIQSPVTPAD